MALHTHRDILFEFKRAKNVLFYKGADISADAGLATFYNPGEKWENYDISELSSKQGFDKDLNTTWQWYQHRRRSVAENGATESHLLIRELTLLLKNSNIINQNVDCLHQIAGSKNILELQGNIFKSRCSNCSNSFTQYTIHEEEVPQCDRCGGYIRPNVVWFGEEVDRHDYRQARDLAMNCDVFITIGIYQQMFPAKELIEISKENGAFMFEISKERSIHSSIMNRVLTGKYNKIIKYLIDDYKALFVDINVH